MDAHYFRVRTDYLWFYYVKLDAYSRGFTYYFSWVGLDFSGIKQDIKTLTSFRLPDAHSGGIASTIQGFGVLALLIVALSGGLWFLLNTMQSNLAETVIHWHKFFTTFIEVYFYAHGAMGVLHILIEKYKSRSVNLSD